MPEEIRALIFISIIVAIPLALFSKFASYYNLKKEVQTFTIAWIGITLLAFLTYNFWVFTILSGIFLLVICKENNVLKIALFFLLMLSIPTGSINIPGFGLVNFILTINFPMFLSAVLLLPLAIGKRNSNRAIKSSELFLYVFFFLNLIVLYQETSYVYQGELVVRESSITSVLRFGVSLFLGLIVPYWAISKNVKTTRDIKIIFMAIVFGALLQASIAIAETMKGWHLYNSLETTLGIASSSSYISRENMLRASASLSHPITLGLVLAVGFGISLYFMNIKSKKPLQMYWLMTAVFLTGLATTLSRGPWVGTGVIVLAYLFTGDRFIKRASKLALVGIFSIAILMTFPTGQKIVGLIPYLNLNSDTQASQTISYRERLWDQSIKVIKKNPLFGSVDYLRDPEMEKMRQGQGIIDMVNSYLAIALEYGLVGLTIFLSIFIFLMIKLYKALNKLKKIPEKHDLWLQGRVIFAVMSGLLFILFTTGRGLTSDYLTWSLLGLGVAYVNMFQLELLKVYSSKQQTINPEIPLNNQVSSHQQ